MNYLILFCIVTAIIGVSYYIYKVIWGKCPYCGSRDIVPDNGLFFYCNKCRRKA
jgi:hypothetical protein